jgi:hypothetical protein
LKRIKFSKIALNVEKGDEVSLSGEQCRPASAGIVEDAFELLAAMRLARKAHTISAGDAHAAMKAVIGQERTRRNRLAAI